VTALAVPRPSLVNALRDDTPSGKDDSPAARLLDVQFWLMGRDAEHPDGNLLPRLGFRREPVPAGRPGTSRYRRTGPDGVVVLWPCGLFLGDDDGGCLLIRGHAPAVAEDPRPPDAFAVSEIVAILRCSRACPPARLSRAATWLAGYEAEVERCVGVAHRVPVPGVRSRLAPPEPCSLARAWRELAAAADPGAGGTVDAPVAVRG